MSQKHKTTQIYHTVVLSLSVCFGRLRDYGLICFGSLPDFELMKWWVLHEGTFTIYTEGFHCQLNKLDSRVKSD